MAGLNDNAKNAMLNNLGTLALYVSLHTADPGATGTSECTGGSPAYARKSIGSWGAAASASMAQSGTDPVFDLPACTITHCGFWSAATSGTFYGSAVLSASETFAAQGNYTLTAATISLT
jgi:hypothetical protein